MPKENIVARSRIRFTPDGNEFGFLSYNTEKFQKDAAVLVINESIHGSCVVFNRLQIPEGLTIETNLQILVKIGNLDPVKAIIRWVKLVDKEIVKIGVEYSENRHEIKFS
jgi:hypothetical protein